MPSRYDDRMDLIDKRIDYLAEQVRSEKQRRENNSIDIRTLQSRIRDLRNMIDDLDETVKPKPKLRKFHIGRVVILVMRNNETQ